LTTSIGYFRYNYLNRSFTCYIEGTYICLQTLGRKGLIWNIFLRKSLKIKMWLPWWFLSMNDKMTHSTYSFVCKNVANFQQYLGLTTRKLLVQLLAIAYHMHSFVAQLNVTCTFYNFTGNSILHANLNLPWLLHNLVWNESTTSHRAYIVCNIQSSIVAQFGVTCTYYKL